MKQKDLRIVMPQRGDAVNEAEVLGASVWLWMHSERHRLLALHHLNQMLLPVIQQGQYLLVFEADQPVFFFSWAYFDDAAEQRYLADPEQLIDATDWSSGDRMWLIDWIAPFGHTHRMRYLLDEELLTYSCSRILCRTANGGRARVLQHRGRHVSPSEAINYFNARPLQFLSEKASVLAVTTGDQG